MDYSSASHIKFKSEISHFLYMNNVKLYAKSEYDTRSFNTNLHRGH